MWRMIIVLALCACTGVRAQTSGEWLDQKKTQLRYLAEQIAALKVYAGHLQKGYGIVRGGLTAVDDLKRGEFSLHKSYFNGLKTAKPAIRQSWKVASIFASLHQLMRLYKTCGRELEQLKVLDRHNAAAAVNAWNSILTAVMHTVSDLELVTGSNAVSLSDGARMSRIDLAYQEMAQHEQFAVDLAANIRSMVAQLKIEAASVSTLKRMFEK